MLPKIYIKSISATLPQAVDEDGNISSIAPLSEHKMQVVAPNFATLIPPAQARRMSKLNKMSIYTGLKALALSGSTADAIITGTSKASKGDSEKFLRDMIQYREEMLNPTPFIMSTYNAANGALALMTNCKGYNQTFVHKGSAFEWALLDAQMVLAQEKDVRNILIGGYDETTDDYYNIKNNIGYWKRELTADMPWYAQQTAGTIPGEGAAFILGSIDPQRTTAIAAVDMLQEASADEVVNTIQERMQQLGWRHIDAIVLGYDGDIRHQEHYDTVAVACGSTASIWQYKPLCGEFETSSAIALWMVVKMLEQNRMPKELQLKKGQKESRDWRRILIYNSFMLKNNSLIYLENYCDI